MSSYSSACSKFKFDKFFAALDKQSAKALQKSSMAKCKAKKEIKTK